MSKEASVMEAGSHVRNEGFPGEYSNLLELSASGDLASFISEVEGNGSDLAERISWYGRRIGTRKMGFEERTPLMIAAMFGNVEVVRHMVESGKVDVNTASGSDGATALHCAAAGGSNCSLEVVRLLVDASADADSLDANSYKPVDLIAPALKHSCGSRRKALEMLLSGIRFDGRALPDYHPEDQTVNRELEEQHVKYPLDTTLPDINQGIYGTDEFRMYSFKVKPCSRAYSHDWTECPFVHPGENARRRDPRKYPYSCVPCLEFRKGSCQKGDSCDYAHGVFECWLHPAQYRTRLCKDDTGCNRKVCFFAHKPDELRPLYASTGSAIPSPKSLSSDEVAVNQLVFVSSAPPMSPSRVTAAGSPKSGSLWNKASLAAHPSLQLPVSRFRSSFNAQDFDMEMELLRLGGNLDPTLLSQLQGSPTQRMCQNANQLRASYPCADALSTSPLRKSSSFGLSRPSGFKNRSQGYSGSGGLKQWGLSDWSSPNGKLDWSFGGEEMNRMKKATSFAFRGSNVMAAPVVQEPDASWVNSLVKEQQFVSPRVENLYIEQQQMVA